jgi:hypothetical protein
MMRQFLPLVFFFCVTAQFAFSQNLFTHDPQQLYNGDGSLFDPSILRQMDVTFEDGNYHSVLVDAFFNNPSLRIPANVTIDGISVDSVGVRYKGNSTFCLPLDVGSVKVPYNLDFNHWISGQDLMGYNKVKLANAWLDPTYCKEYIASRIYRKYLPTPEINLIELHTQGDYTGLYVNTESINRQFLNKHFDENDGVLFKCDGAGVFCGEDGEGTDGGVPSLGYLGADTTNYYDSYTIKSDYGWEALLDLINTLEFAPEDLGDVLNIDRVLWAMAVNTVVSNLDTYNGYYVHNYYLYQDVEGRFQMIPWDFDNSFVGAIMGWSYWNPNDVYNFDPFFTGNGASWDNRPLVQYLYSQPLYRQLYLAHIRTIMEESMEVQEIAEEISAFQTLANDAAQSDSNALFPFTYFNTNVFSAFWSDWGFGGILSTVEARMNFLSSHPEVSDAGPVMGSVAVENGTVQVPTIDATGLELMWTTGDIASNFQSIAMSDDGTQGDAVVGDGTFTALLPDTGGENLLFYIRASNADAISLSPARAEYEYYIYGNVTGVDEFELTTTATEPQWTIAPNPASESFSLRNCPAFSPVTILDFQGRVVMESIWDGRPIDVSQWAGGAYLIQVGEFGTSSMQRLMVQ